MSILTHFPKCIVFNTRKMKLYLYQLAALLRLRTQKITFYVDTLNDVILAIWYQKLLKVVK